MKKVHYLFGIMLLMAGYSTNVCAQVSNDNEDEVYKVERPQAKDFVPGQVLFKLKDGQRAQVRRAGAQTTAGISSLDKVLKEYAVQEMEQLLPNAKVKGTPRRAKAYNGQTIVERDLTQLYKVTLPEEKAMQVMEMVEQLKALDEVEFAEPNYKMYIMADDHIADSYKTNPYVNQQWGLDAYGVKELWNKKIVNPERPVIAILDTGVDLTHPDLKDNLWTNTVESEGEAGYDNDGNGFKGDVHGWDFVNNSPNIRDNNMHGTHVAGIAAACNNGVGIIGANPQALIMPITVMQSDGTGDMATIIEGIDYAAQNGATVINMSLGSYTNSRALRQALERAYHSAVIVASAGNDGKPIELACGKMPCPAPCFPAAYTFVLGVMATAEGGGYAGFTNFDCNGPNFSESATTLQDPDGFNYELKAPGTNILSTIPGGKYKELQGTSMAAPLVAGAISALMMVKQYDTQEMLWGDLTHTDNIAQAYNLESHPADLELVKVQIKDRKELADETEEDYGGDNEVDAGETIDIYPVLRTTFGAANNIKIKLETGEFEDPNIVEILSGTVDFGINLSSYGRGVCLNPLKIKVPSNIADNRHVVLKLTATCDDLTDAFEKEFTIVVTNMVKIGGIINENRTLTADHIYYVTENIGVPEGVTLTIEPGTRLEFKEGMGISSSGRLIANGTPKKPIIFTGHNGALWANIASHESIGERQYPQYLYTNENKTLFTLLPTEQTPTRFSFDQYRKYFYYNSIIQDNPGKCFHLGDYVEEFYDKMWGYYGKPDFTAKQHLLTDVNYLTEAVLKLLADFTTYCESISSNYVEEWSEGLSSSDVMIDMCYWYIYDNPRDTLSYCKLDGYSTLYLWNNKPFLKDCIISPREPGNGWGAFRQIEGLRCNILDYQAMSYISPTTVILSDGQESFKHCNIVNNDLGYFYDDGSGIMEYTALNNSNYFNNTQKCIISGDYYDKPYLIGIYSRTPKTVGTNNPSYLGSSREDVIRPLVYEIGNGPSTYGSVDLSNMPNRPYAEAHGIVWKVVVNGKDAQDEYEDLAPLGVGKHKFEVYFNRPMNKAVAPQIYFGVREPYTQNVVAEDGEGFGWNADGTIYTAYVTINGRTNSDGINRIYVYGAQDNEYFEIPYEKTRFNIQINAAGSMATGFAAEAGMGRVNLTWNNSENDFADAMGFNIYRYGDEYEKTLPAGYYNGYKPTEWDKGTYYDERTVMIADTVRLNTEILDIETKTYTDYNVVPGQNYYYYYKVLSTDLQEYDVSNVVHAKPLTSTLGDANGSGVVDVADVITTVNHAAGMEPKPFIFEAADMNADKCIDILDVIGIIQKILNPNAAPAMISVESMAVYTIEDGVLYVETPIALAGVQVQVNNTADSQYQVAEDLDGFEHTSAWLSDNDMLFLAYNMNGKTLTEGKHALLIIGDGDVTNLRLSDTQGHNVPVEFGGQTTGVDAMGSKVQTQKGIYDLQGRKLSPFNSHLSTLKKGVYIINGEKVVK